MTIVKEQKTIRVICVYTNEKWQGKYIPNRDKNLCLKVLTHWNMASCMVNQCQKLRLRSGYNTIDKLIDRLTPASENPKVPTKGNETRNKASIRH
jgi:hypothetical protein